jgi:hypothetical protein
LDGLTASVEKMRRAGEIAFALFERVRGVGIAVDYWGLLPVLVTNW